MKPRWWRVAVLVERDGDPWTWTFHVRARREEGARGLVADRLDGERHLVFTCHPSEPLPQVPPTDAIAADYGPYRRRWDDPMLAEVAAMWRAMPTSRG